MDVKELDKKQLILLTLLITFVVSIATGIVTVSLMNQMPKSVPQTINNVIQRTIEKVTTVQVPAPKTADTSSNSATAAKDETASLFGNGDALVSIYLKNGSVNSETAATTSDTTASTTPDTGTTDISNPIDTSVDASITGDASATAPSADANGITNNTGEKAVGQGVIISDIGLVLADSSIIKDKEQYKVILNNTDFDLSVLKSFSNGFTILKITPIETTAPAATTDTTKNKTQ